MDLDDEESYLNHIRTFEDILDSPLLTTVRRDILAAVNFAAQYHKKNYAAYKSGGMYLTGSFRNEMIRHLKKKKKEDGSNMGMSKLEYSACDLVLDFSEEIPEIDLLTIEDRYRVLNSLKKVLESHL